MTDRLWSWAEEREPVPAELAEALITPDELPLS